MSDAAAAASVQLVEAHVPPPEVESETVPVGCDFAFGPPVSTTVTVQASAVPCFGESVAQVSDVLVLFRFDPQLVHAELVTASCAVPWLVT